MAHSIIVLGGGWSVSQYNLRGLEERGMVIAVNDAAIYTKPHVAFTMDRLWIEGRQHLLRTLGLPSIYYRRGTPKNFVPPKSWHAYDHEGIPAMSWQTGRLNGSNSGTCALNLAFQLRHNHPLPVRVFLLGFDMQHGPAGEKHWYPDYPWVGGSKKGKLAEWAGEFKTIAQQFKQMGIEVFNVNHRSLITAFTTISFDEFTRMSS